MDGKTPQQAVDMFWKSFHTKAPGKGKKKQKGTPLHRGIAELTEKKSDHCYPKQEAKQE